MPRASAMATSWRKPFAIDPVIGQHEALRRLAPGAEALQHGGRLAERRQDRHAMDAPADPAAAAIQYADHRIGSGGVAPRHPDEGLGRIARPHQQHRHGERAGPLAELAQIAVAQQAVAEAGRPQEDDQHEPVDQHRRARIALETGGEELQRQEEQHGQADGAGDLHQIGQRDIAPDAAVHAGEDEDGGGAGREHAGCPGARKGRSLCKLPTRSHTDSGKERAAIATSCSSVRAGGGARRRRRLMKARES